VADGDLWTEQLLAVIDEATPGVPLLLSAQRAR